MYAFECSLHARPSNDSQEAETPLVDQWGQWSTLLVSQDQLSKPLPTEFDDAINKLGALPRLFAEPDGSFVWTSPHENIRWQVNGNLYEKNDNILFVELKGCCPQVEFDQLLACFLADENVCVIQLTRAAVLFQRTFSVRMPTLEVSRVTAKVCCHRKRVAGNQLMQ